LLRQKGVLKKAVVYMPQQFQDMHLLFDGFWQGFIDDPAFENILKQDLEDGNHSNPVNHPMYFTDHIFIRKRKLKMNFQMLAFF
jgi:hypothetical protein